MPAMICAAVHVSFYYIQISRAILGQDQKLRLPKFLEEEEKSPEATKQVRSCSIVCMSAHSSASCVYLEYISLSHRQAASRCLMLYHRAHSLCRIQ